MPTLTTVSKMIKTARGKDFSDNSIGKSLGISAAEVARIASGKHPGIEVSKRLGITPICHVCKRKILPKREKVIPPLIGRDANWFEYFSKLEAI